MEVEIYKLLSRYYHYDWEDFALKYIDLITSLLEQNRVDKAEILDLACGSGVLAYELGILGHIIIGVDRSPEMIELARHKCRNLPQVNFEIGDMVEFELERKFDLITCTFDSINYLTEPEQLRSFFNLISEHLKAEGLFLFDSNTALKYEHFDKQVFERNYQGEEVIQRGFYDSDSGLAKIEFEFAGGSIEKHIQRPYGRADLEPYLAQNALELRLVFSSFKRDEYTEKSMHLIGIVNKI